MFAFTLCKYINVIIKFMHMRLVAKHAPVVMLVVEWCSDYIIVYCHLPLACERTSSDAESEAVVFGAVCEQCGTEF